MICSTARGRAACVVRRLQRGTRAAMAAVMTAVLATLLAACGGGGGGGADAEGGGAGGLVPGATALTISTPQASASVSLDLDAAPSVTAARFTIRVDNLSGNYWYHLDHERHDWLSMSVVSSARSSDFDIEARWSFVRQVPDGSTRVTVNVKVCADNGCRVEARGSPLRLTLDVFKGRLATPEAGLPVLPLGATRDLDHDVVASAYSAPLDALVVAASQPTPALIVYPLGAGQTAPQRLALGQVPRDLSLSPDGLKVALAHDAAVSLADLGPAGPGGLSRWPVSLDLGRVVLDGQGRVHLFSNTPHAWATHATLDLATGAEVLRSGFGVANRRPVYGLVEGGLHPQGDRLYVADTNLSPSDVHRIDFSGDQAWMPIDSAYHGDHPVCGGLWFLRDGSRMASGCGTVFSTSSAPALDMRYAGSLPLDGATEVFNRPFRIVAFSDGLGGAPMAFIESNWSRCLGPLAIEPITACRERLVMTDGPGFPVRGRWGLGPRAVGEEHWPQRSAGLHRRGDGRLVLLTEARRTGSSSTWHLHLLPALP